MSGTDLIPLIAVAVATLVASVTDLWKFKIYNVLTMPTLLAGLCVSAWLGGWGGLASSLMGAGLGFGLLVVFFAMGGVGPGDVKLLAAVGAWLGPYLTYQVFVAAALFQGVYAVALILGQQGVLGLAIELIAAKERLISPGSWRLPSETIHDRLPRPDRRRRLVPFAAMTCLGFFATLAWWGRDLDRVWPPDNRDPRRPGRLGVGDGAGSRGGPMNARMMIVGALAVACGLSAMVLVRAMRRPPDGPAVETTSVVFVAADVKPGETVQAAMLEVREIPKAEVPEDAILKTADAIDRAAMTQLDKGDLLRERKLAERGAGRGMAALIRSGMRAFTIQTPSFSSSMAGFLLPGNKVDVLLTVSSQGGVDDETGGASTTTLLQNVEILAVHTTVNAPTANKIDPDQARSITLLVSPDDVALLDLGQNKGTLHLSLRNPEGHRRRSSPSR